MVHKDDNQKELKNGRYLMPFIYRFISFNNYFFHGSTNSVVEDGLETVTIFRGPD